jgi:hypothetical protein
MKPTTLEQLIGSDPGWTWIAANHASRRSFGHTVDVRLEPGGWLTAGIPVAGSPLEGAPLDLSLLEAQGRLAGPFRFAANVPGWASGVWLLAELCLPGGEAAEPAAELLGHLTPGMAAALRGDGATAGGATGSQPGGAGALQVGPSGNAPDAEDGTALDGLGDELESYLKAAENDWSRRPGPCSFVVRRDLDAYFQKIVIAPEGGAIVFRSPLTALPALVEPSLTAVPDFLLAANGALRLVRVSVTRATPEDGVEAQASARSVVLEVVVPRRLWNCFPLERIFGSLLVGARLAGRETEVLFEPNAAERYLDVCRTVRKEIEQHAHPEYAYQHTAR